MLSILCMVPLKVIGLIVFSERYVLCSAIDIFCMEKLKPCKTDITVFFAKN